MLLPRFPLLLSGVLLLSASASAGGIPLDPSRWHLEMNPRTKASIEPVTDKTGTTHTVQYVATNTIYDWPYLREKFPGVYEGGADIANNVWFHARLEIDGTTVQVFVNEGKTPVLVVKDLKLGDHSGMIGFWGYPGAFANLKVSPRTP